MLRFSLILLASFLLVGCANNRMAIEGPSTGEYMAALPLMEYQESSPTGSIFTDSRRSCIWLSQELRDRRHFDRRSRRKHSAPEAQALICPKRCLIRH